MRRKLKVALLAITFPIWALPWTFWQIADLTLKDIEAGKARACPTRDPRA